MKNKWQIEVNIEGCSCYNPNRDESWIVTDGVMNFLCWEKSDAEWLCDHLNKSTN